MQPHSFFERHLVNRTQTSCNKMLLSDSRSRLLLKFFQNLCRSSCNQVPQHIFAFITVSNSSFPSTFSNHSLSSLSQTLLFHPHFPIIHFPRQFPSPSLPPQQAWPSSSTPRQGSCYKAPTQYMLHTNILVKGSTYLCIYHPLVHSVVHLDFLTDF